MNKTTVFCQISDSHFSKNSTSEIRLKKVIDDINKKDVHHVIFSGDLVLEPTTQNYAELYHFLDTHLNGGINVYSIPGNHDDVDLLKQAAPHSRFSSPGYIDITEHTRIHLIDSSKRFEGSVLGSGYVPQSALSQLRKRIKHTHKLNSVFAIHHPPVTFGADWFQKICLTNADNFIKSVQTNKQNSHVIFGHSHVYFHNNKDNIEYISCPSSWAGFNHENHTKTEKTDDFGYLIYFENEHNEIEHEAIML